MDLPAQSGVAEPRAEYARRREAMRERQGRQGRLEALAGNGRLVVFVAGLGIAYLVVVARRLEPFWLAVPVALFVVLVLWHERVRRRWSWAGRAAAYYEKSLARLEGHWPGTGEPGTRFVDEDHPYLLDLDIFGSGSLFERLNTARTRVGEDTLAGWLRAPAAAGEVRARQQAVLELRPRLDLREDLALRGPAAAVDLEALLQWGRGEPLLASRFARFVATVLVSLSLAALAGLATGDIGPSPYVLLLALQGGFALWLKSRVRQVIAPVDRRAHELAVFAGILARIEREAFTAPRLLQIQNALQAHGRRPEGSKPSQRIARLVRLVNWLDCTHNPYFALVAPFVLWTTQLAFAFEAWRTESGSAIRHWLEAVGDFEALNALAAYSYENPDDPFPEIVSSGAGEGSSGTPVGPCYDGTELGHPLLPADRCVRNDVHLGDEVRLLVVSGSNMSGKSTLLRTVGINAVLALAGAPVRARRLRLSLLTVGATLRIQDSLQAGRSRFYAEITRVRRLVELARGPIPLLFLLDELLHGTNSHDRRQGAEAIVRTLIAQGALGLITTHDLALTHIVDQLPGRAVNVHFADHIDNGTITFDYRMRPGVVEHSNALALMRAVGLEV